MKIRNFFALILASVVFVACSNEDDDNGGVVKNPEGKAWISLSIKKANSSGLRSLNSTEEDPGTANEADVFAVRAIFFGDGPGYSVVDDKDITTNQSGNAGQPAGSPGEAFEIDATSKYIMIVINPPAGYTADWTAVPGANLAMVNAAVSGTAADLTASSTGFMMTNAKGDLEPSVSATDPTLKALTLYTTKALAESSPLTINVDRVVAKTRLYTKNYSAPNAIVSDIFWVMNITNKMYYPMSKRVKTAEDTPTPFDQYSLGSYREDPNYDHATLSISYPGANYTANYNYYDNTSTISTSDWINPVDSLVPGEPQYCLENTQQAADNNYSFTTQMLVKAKYLPSTYLLADNTTSTTQETNSDWIRISGAAYTYTSLMTYIEVELTNKYKSANPATYSTPRANALNNYLSSLSIAEVTIPSTGVPGDETALIAAFNGKKADILAKGAARAGTFGTFSYYAEGINYYKIAIKHDNTNANKNLLGEFGVVRNSVYDVRITKFNNPGYPVIPDPVPDPIDPDDASWLSVQININPWTWYVQQEEL